VAGVEANSSNVKKKYFWLFAVLALAPTLLSAQAPQTRYYTATNRSIAVKDEGYISQVVAWVYQTDPLPAMLWDPQSTIFTSGWQVTPNTAVGTVIGNCNNIPAKGVWLVPGGNGDVIYLQLKIDTYNYRANTLVGRPDGRSFLAWETTAPSFALWVLDTAGNYLGQSAPALLGPYPNWSLVSAASTPDNKCWLLLNSAYGHAALWRFSAAGVLEKAVNFGPYLNWTAFGMDVGSDGKVWLGWYNKEPDVSEISLWRLHADGVYETGAGGKIGDMGVNPGAWTLFQGYVAFDWPVKLQAVPGGGVVVATRVPRFIRFNADAGYDTNWAFSTAPQSFFHDFSIHKTSGQVRILWGGQDPNRAATLWFLDANWKLQYQPDYGPYDTKAAPVAVTQTGEGRTELMWLDTYGRVGIWRFGAGYPCTWEGASQFGPY
jgi:hypothetical protein